MEPSDIDRRAELLFSKVDLNQSKENVAVSEEEQKQHAIIMSSGADRGASPNTVTADLATIAETLTRIDAKLDTLTTNVETNTTNLGTLTTKVDTLEESLNTNTANLGTLTTKVESLSDDVRRGFQATLSAVPGILLNFMKVAIVEEKLQGAVRGLPGHGASTWTYIKHLGKLSTTFFAVSCAHCALEYKSLTDGKTQFVVIPTVLIPYVSGVQLLRDGHRFGFTYDGAKNQDIIILELNSLPDTVNEDEVLEWHDRKNELLEVPYWALVAGESLKSPILGRNAIVDSRSNCWLFMLDSLTEPGQSGTVILGTTKKDTECLTPGNFDKEKSSSPVLLGVYTGTYSVESSLQLRGRVCPLPPPAAFALKTLQEVNFPKGIKLEKWVPTTVARHVRHVQEKSTWNVHQERTRPDGLVYKLQSAVAGNKPVQTMHGVFINAPFADKKNKSHFNNLPKILEPNLDTSHSRKSEGNLTDIENDFSLDDRETATDGCINCTIL